MFYKYPRTPRLSSEGRIDDDLIRTDLSGFIEKEVIITEKIIGENITLDSEQIYLREDNPTYKASQSQIKEIWSKISWKIENNIRICGENVNPHYQKRNTRLSSHFVVFSVWDQMVCKSWDETVDICDDLGLAIVPVLDRQIITSYSQLYELLDAIKKETKSQNMEGFVIRTAEEFLYNEFGNNVRKWMNPVFESQKSSKKHKILS